MYSKLLILFAFILYAGTMDTLFSSYREAYEALSRFEITEPSSEIVLSSRKARKLEMQQNKLYNRTPLIFSTGYRHYARDFDFNIAEDELNSKLFMDLKYRILSGGAVELKQQREANSDKLSVEQNRFSQLIRIDYFKELQRELEAIYYKELAFHENSYVDFLSHYVEQARQQYFRKKFDREKLEELIGIYEELSISKMPSGTFVKLPNYILDTTELNLFWESEKSRSFSFENEITPDVPISLDALLRAEYYPYYIDGEDTVNGNLIAELKLSVPIRRFQRRTLGEDEIREAQERERRSTFTIKESEYQRLLMKYKRYSVAQKRSKMKMERRVSEINFLSQQSLFPEMVAPAVDISHHINAFFQYQIEESRIRHQKNSTILSIASLVNMDYKTFRKLVSIEDTKSEDVPIRKGNRSLYLWKDPFHKNSIPFLFTFAKRRSIKRVYVSNLGSCDLLRLDSILVLSASSRVEFIPLLSENSWIESNKMQNGINKIEALADRFQEIHLDVEPQMYDDWRENDYKRVLDFITFLERVRKSFSGKIGLSLPVIYPQEFYPEIAKYCDKITLMVYGTDSVEKIIERSSPIIETIPIPTEIALRCSDFDNEKALEQVIDSLYIHDFSSIAIYDFSLYQELVTQ